MKKFIVTLYKEIEIEVEAETAADALDEVIWWSGELEGDFSCNLTVKEVEAEG